MKNNINTKPLSGFMELKPEAQIQFNKMMEIIKNTYELYGFVPIDTPILERAEVLLAKGGDDTDKQIYRFTKGETDLAMRFDLTVPLARYVAEYQNELTFPFRRYAIGKVYRGEKSQAGRFREFYQCDIDVIGKGTLNISFDAEIPLVISTLFQRLGFNNFTIKINNRKILNGFFQYLDIKNKLSDVLRALDKIEKIGVNETTEELKTIGIEESKIKEILSFINIKTDTLKQLDKLNIQNSLFQEGLKELQEVDTLLKASGVNNDIYKIDLTIARGLDYYTGTVYETILNDYPQLGSVCGGGRYDNLTDYYTSNKYQGVGITFGLTRFFYLLNKGNFIDTSKKTNTKVLVVCNDDTQKEAFKVANVFRNKDINAEILLGFREGIGYANSLGIPFVIFIGETEIKEKKITIKNMATREQKLFNLNEGIEYVINN